MRTLVLGDIHGAYKALEQCLERSRFDPEADHLIFLGDVSDRGPDTVECIDLLLTIKNLTAIKGNHDIWTLDWLSGNSYDEEVWFKHGGLSTFESYSKHGNLEHLRKNHLDNYFDQLLPFYKDKNRVFVHAGFDLDRPIESSDPNKYYWDRELFKAAVHYHPMKKAFPIGSAYKEIYIGHSPTHRLSPHFDGSVPIKFCNVWCMDQGAGWGNKLSIMDIESKEVFQSDKVSDLYS